MGTIRIGSCAVVVDTVDDHVSFVVVQKVLGVSVRSVPEQTNKKGFDCPREKMVSTLEISDWSIHKPGDVQPVIKILFGDFLPLLAQTMRSVKAELRCSDPELATIA